MTEEREKKNKRIAAAVTIGVHAILAIIFLLVMAWRAPNPPHPEYGVVLNYGLDDAGAGPVQPDNPPTEETEDVEESTPEESQPETSEEQVEEAAEEIVEETTDLTHESPVTAPEKKEEKKIEKPAEKKAEPAEEKPEKKEERKVENTFPSSDTKGSTPSQGEKTGTGDQGDPEGSKEVENQYGNPGGGGGSSFDLEGWNWDYIPKPDDKSNENGRLVFQIKVNADGEVIGITTLERGVGPAVEKIYRSEVQKLTFSRKSSSGQAPPISTGTITFVIRSK